MEKKMENKMETGVIKESKYTNILTLGPEVCKCDLHWAIWIPGVLEG